MAQKILLWLRHMWIKPKGSMGTPYLTKVWLDDLHTVFGPGVFPKPSAPVISPPSAPPAPEITMGDPSQLNLPSATLAPEINMDDPYHWNSDEEKDEDDYDDGYGGARARQRIKAQIVAAPTNALFQEAFETDHDFRSMSKRGRKRNWQL
ncbi:hypothetical protein BS47DRAFT_1358781 [Hydnum rufescens UP504]|uniref:Uncharacterized protein n=1 Tax=Hydnum rufescens UP504 TaxID=1448309 RepID=A0A9P6E163_9AGAM|nr:hypothetical protein BS47DRAFT_1358781 [Hydnum rufescens UP504]